MFHENKRCLFITVTVAVLCNKVNSFPHGHGQNILPFKFGERREPEPNKPFFSNPPITGFQPFDPRFIQDKLRSFTPHGYFKPDFDASSILPNFDLHGNHYNKHLHDRRPMKGEINAVKIVERNKSVNSYPTTVASRGSETHTIKDSVHNDDILMSLTRLKPSMAKNTKLQTELMKPNITTDVTINAMNKITPRINDQKNESIAASTMATQATDAYKPTLTEISKVVEIDDNDFGSQFLNDKSEAEASTHETTTDMTTTEYYDLTTGDDIFNRMGGVPPGVVASLLG